MAYRFKVYRFRSCRKIYRPRRLFEVRSAGGKVYGAKAVYYARGRENSFGLYSETSKPAVTSLLFDDRALGALTCKVLLHCIQGEEVKPKTLLGYELAVRESTLFD